MRTLAIIPARGGSKRIPRKNIKSFLGKPIIAYSIQAALDTHLFNEVMVSTDEDQIATAARALGATVPFIRSSENANDFATLADVVLEVMVKYEKQGQHFDAICCILPTAPLITAKKVRVAFEKLQAQQLDSVCPVVEFSYPILRALEVSDDQKLKMIWPEHLKTRSQDLKPAYHDSGSFYWIKTEALRTEKSFFCENGGMVVLNEMEVQDIDTDTDWQLAELKYKLNHAQA